MKGKLVILILVLLAAAGCNLSVNVIDNPPPQQPTNTQPSAIVERPTQHAATTTPLPTVPTVVQPTPIPSCTPRNDWPQYTVVVGDTLGRIAVRTGTTAAALTQANCLANANLISVGQSLRVPRQPTPPTAVPPTVIPTRVAQQIGSINISKYLWADAGNYVLPGGESIRLTWDGGPADALRTDFFQRANNGSMTLIGSDTNPADGLYVLWQAPSGFLGEVTATALRSDGSSATTLYNPSISVIDPNSNTNAITLNTYLRVENGAYFLKPNQPEVISWVAAPLAATHVDFTFSPGDHSAPRALGSVTNLINGASITATFSAGDYGILSAEAFLRDGTHLFFARPITINVPAVVEVTVEPTAEATAAQ